MNALKVLRKVLQRVKQSYVKPPWLLNAFMDKPLKKVYDDIRGVLVEAVNEHVLLYAEEKFWLRTQVSSNED